MKKLTDIVDDINQIMSLGEFLSDLGIESSGDLLDECDNALMSNSCEECGEPLEYECGCYSQKKYPDGMDYENR